MESGRGFSELITTLFGTDPRGLERFVRQRVEQGAALALDINWDRPMGNVAFALYKALANRGLIEPALFQALVEDYPGRADQIMRVGRAFVAEEARKPSPAAHPLAAFRYLVYFEVPPEHVVYLAPILKLTVEQHEKVALQVLDHIGKDRGEARKVVNMLAGLLGDAHGALLARLQHSVEEPSPGSEPARPDPDHAVALVHKLRVYRFDRIIQWGHLMLRAKESQRHEVFLLYGPAHQRPDQFLLRLRQRAFDSLNHDLIRVELEPDGLVLHQAQDVTHAIALAVPGGGHHASKALARAAATRSILLVPVLRSRPLADLDDTQLDALCEFLADQFDPLLAAANPAHAVRLVLVVQGRQDDAVVSRLRAALKKLEEGRLGLPSHDLGELGYPSWEEARNELRAEPRYQAIPVRTLDTLRSRYEAMCESEASLEEIVEFLYQAADLMLANP